MGAPGGPPRGRLAGLTALTAAGAVLLAACGGATGRPERSHAGAVPTTTTTPGPAAPVTSATSPVGVPGTAAGTGSGPGTTTRSSPTPATAGASAAPSTPGSGASWVTYHGDNQRSGQDRSGVVLRPLRTAWTSGALDGQVYAEPLVWGGLVIVATENDTVYGLRASDGTGVWRTHVGAPVPLSALPCGNVDPLGITGTPVVDPATGRLFALVETDRDGSVAHELVALDAATGRILFQEPADPPGMTPRTQQERGALVVVGGRVYVPYGGLYGDCGQYHGWLVAASTAAPGPLSAYQVPAAREGAIWAPPGPTVDAAGNLWVATGNGSSTGAYDYGDSVIELTPDLRVVGSFAPSNWAQDNATDADLGSTSPVLLTGGLVFQVGKQGTGYLLAAAHPGGIGGQVYSRSVCSTIGGNASGPSDVYVPCESGIEDVHVSVSPPSFRVAWTGPPGATGPPIVAGGLIWSVGASSRTLYGLDPSTGSAVVQEALAGPPAPYSTPAVGNGILVVGTGHGVEAFRGPGGTGG